MKLVTSSRLQFVPGHNETKVVYPKKITILVHGTGRVNKLQPSGCETV